VIVPDERFDWLCNTYKPKSKVPAFLEARSALRQNAVTTRAHTDGNCVRASPHARL
jgi:hypothetical protein